MYDVDLQQMIWLSKELTISILISCDSSFSTTSTRLKLTGVLPYQMPDQSHGMMIKVTFKIAWHNFLFSFLVNTFEKY